MSSVSRNAVTSNKPLRILVVARVSDPRPGKQDERSVKDQENMIRSWIDQNFQDTLEIETYASSGRGEWIDRAEFLELCDKVSSGEYEVVITEDLGRIIRRLRAHMFAEECVDHGVRLIAINDHVDTDEPGWQDRSIFSAWHHERSNRDASDRIKRTHRARFQQGGCAAIPIYGYVKPDGAKTDEDWKKDPDAEPIYKDWFRRLERGDSFSEIADWLNELDVPTGPYCDGDEWDGTMVGRISRNHILKGVRRRNKRESWRDSRGKYRTREADPSKLLEREVPHLAFFDAAYYDRVIKAVNEKNEKYANGAKLRNSSRHRASRKRTRFPGQMIHCGICGRLYVFGGHGQKDHLMCDGARKYRCWNAVTVDGPLAAREISQAVLSAIIELPDFDEAFLADINAESTRLDAERNENVARIDRELKDIERQLDNLVSFVREGNGSERIRGEMERLEQEQIEFNSERQRLLDSPSKRIEIPPIEELKDLAAQLLREPNLESWEFCKRMKNLIPRIVVFPVRLVDGGIPVLRSTFRLQASQLITADHEVEALKRPLERIITVDLFSPPQRAAYRERIRDLRDSGMTERAAAAACGITVTAAQRASVLQRKMDELGTFDPYVRLNEPPPDYKKLRRHLHRRYNFEPLPDAGQI